MDAFSIFHITIWQRFRKYGLCKKGSYEQNSELLFNIQLMAFMDRKKNDNFYKKLTKKYKEEKFKRFFSYFKRNWMGERIPIRIWNFYDIISKESIDERFYYTNNLTENINRYLNSNLKRSRCSRNIFKEAIINIILQFEVKVINEVNNNKKTDLLIFYISKKESNNILDSNDIKKLIIDYKEIQFKNINTKYSDISDDEPDINAVDDNESIDNEDD